MQVLCKKGKCYESALGNCKTRACPKTPSHGFSMAANTTARVETMQAVPINSSSFGAIYEALNPTTKKVLKSLLCTPKTDSERDVYKFLQRFISGLDMAKLLNFLQFTTAMDIMGTQDLIVSFISTQGFGSRPIAQTCGPLLEVPSTYNNFVELREEFENILNQANWENDIM